jgi:RNA 2',3'-cyclic 3'-phosphodiesterase
MKRTFIAVPVEASEKLRHITTRLKQEFKRDALKWVEPENMHITLKFLGGTPEEMIVPISEKLEMISLKFQVLTGRMESLDTFSNRGKPAVLFTRLVDLPMLEQMATIIDEELKTFGFLPESRAFKSHLTLARIKYLYDTRNFYNLVKSYCESDIQPVSIEKIIFFESVLLPTGPLYRPLKIVTLNKQETV